MRPSLQCQLPDLLFVFVLLVLFLLFVVVLSGEPTQNQGRGLFDRKLVFCVHMHSFACLIRRTPPSTFSDTAITNRHSDTIIFQLRAHWVRISWSVGSEIRNRTCAPGGSPTLNFLRPRRAPYPQGQALQLSERMSVKILFILKHSLTPNLFN